METLTLERHDRVAVVRLDRPPVNAVTRQMMTELRETFGALGEDRDINAIVLSAAGTRAFCAGVDLTDVGEQRRNPVTVADTLDGGSYWRTTQHVVRHCPVPVIAAVDAPAIGGGFGLVGVCDLIVASERATFALTEINVGLLGGSSKALRMVGPFKARMLFFSGEPIDAHELHRHGAVERLVAAGEAEASAIELATTFADKSPIALRLAKESILRIEDLPLEDAYRLEQDYTNRLRGYADSREAMAAYREKRAAEWTWS